MTDKERELLLRVDEVLFYIWDPINVSGSVAARDEYSSYTEDTFNRLLEAINFQEVAKFLLKLEVSRMGSFDDEETLERCEVTARYLFNYKENLMTEEREI
ncbi:MAG: hypothetical protein KC478_12355 [Bacteriovoracaceae bacterium]|nr:hypothetical protein [Bacteriovoracaceae bacterium]